MTFLGTHISIIGAIMIAGNFLPSFAAADENAGEILFSIKCGRCHSAGRLATNFRSVENLETTRKAFDEKLFRHFLKDATERRLIIDYLVRLANENR